MRTSILVGIFSLAVAVAGITEWASRRASGSPENRSTGAPSHVADRSGSSAREATPPAQPVREPFAPPAARTGAADERPTLATLVLDGSSGGFRLNAVSLPEATADRIDALLTGPEAADLLCGHFVIEGHTDNLGSKEVNEQIGLSRALAVRQYLAENHGIPRDAMRVVSYGADRPVADNATQEGRARNRRVVITIVPHE